MSSDRSTSYEYAKRGDTSNWKKNLIEMADTGNW